MTNLNKKISRIFKMKNLFTKNYWAMKGLALLVLVVMGGSVRGQVYQEDFGTSTTVVVPYTSGTNATGNVIKNENISAPVWNQNLLNANFSGNTLGGLSATTGTSAYTITCTFTVATNFQFNPTSIGFDNRGSSTGPNALTITISGTGGSTSLVLTPTRTASFTTVTPTNFASTSQNLSGAITLTFAFTGGASSSTERFDNVILNGTLSSGCTSPTTQTTSLTTNTTTTTTSNYAFTRGNGNNVLVVARLNGTSSVAPTSGTTYTPSTTGSFTGTTTTGSGNIVVYNGAAAGASTATGNLNLTDLTAGSYYTLTAYEYATTGTCYNTSSPASFNFYTLCDAPISTTPATIGSKSFTATWGAVTGASSYKLDVSTDNGFSSFVSGYNDFTVASTSQAVTGLNYNTTYYFRVRAINASSNASANSNTSSTTTKTVATSLVLVSVPTTGSVATNLTSFTVEARRLDASVDDAYTTNISISKASGSGTISGNGAVAAISGIATFGAIQFDATGTYTITATDGTLTSSASSDIVISIANTITSLWNGGSNSSWLTSGNWDNGLPSETKVAQFGSAAQTPIGFNMNGATLSQRTIAAIEFTSSAIARTINNSSGTVSNNFILSGGIVNGISNVILRNNSSNNMTIENGSTRLLGIALGNITNNIVNIDGTGSINISCIVSGSNQITKAGSGAGILSLTGANTYTGLTTITAGTLKLNYASGNTIPSTNSVTVNGGTLQISSDQTLANLTLTSGTVIIDAGITLTITGTISRTSGVIRGSSTSNLIITGTSGTIAFDQTTPGTTNVLKNLTISGSGTTTIGNTLNMTAGATAGTVIVGTGAILATGGNLILKSDINGTARIGNSAGTITGNVTVERYIPPTRRAYRFLAAPVTTTGGIYAHWQESGTNASGLGIHVTGIAGEAPGGIDNDSGLDKTLTGNSSMFSYNGSGWAAVTNTKTTQLTPGVGFRVLVRGDRLTDLYASSTPAATATTIKATGAVGQGTITLNGLLDGFNLIGNPYPSSIDWNATGWQTARTATNLNDAIYIYDPANVASTNMSYPAYVSGAGTLNCTNIIRSGQAFFVHAAAGGASISFEEAYKSSTVTGGFFRSATPEMMRVTYMQNNEHLDDIVIRYNDDAQASFDPRFDAISMGGDANGLASFKNADRLAIHTRPTAVGEDSVALSVRNTTTGNYQLKFSEMEGFAASTDITLLDKFLNVQYDVKQDSIVAFEITTDVNSKGDDRFWLFYNHKSTGINQQALAKNKINVYPNPASSVINMSLKLTANQKSTYTYNIYNQLGAMVQAGEVDFANGKQAQVNIDAFSPGVYFITASNGKDLQTIKFVK